MTSPIDLPRRVLLAAGLAAALPLRRAAADAEPSAADKIPQREALYRPRPNGQQRCGICLQFMPPNQCRIVQGEISATGWCQYFAAKENAR